MNDDPKSLGQLDRDGDSSFIYHLAFFRPQSSPFIMAQSLWDKRMAEKCRKGSSAENGHASMMRARRYEQHGAHTTMAMPTI